MNSSKYLILASLLLALGGCASTGSMAMKNENTTTLQQKIIKGKTTKQEITQLFGEPQSRSVDDRGNETWTYSYSNSTSNIANFIPYAGALIGGAESKTRIMTVTFYKSNRVKTYNLSESQDETRTGLFNQ